MTSYVERELAWLSKLRQVQHALDARGRRSGLLDDVITDMDGFRQGCTCDCCDHSEGTDCGCECHATGACAFRPQEQTP